VTTVAREPGPALAAASDRPAPHAPQGCVSPQIDDSRRVPAAHEVVIAGVTERPIDAEAHARLVARDTAGAVITFAGVIRDHDRGAAVSWLEYTAHPSADVLMHEIAREVATSFDVDAVAVTHRVGRLEVGDCALAAAVSSAHRAEAFAATSALVEQVKKRLPVWKRQVLTDGTAQWVNSP